jgi:lipopolysaccharide/colanic/teichoic acid biosynthesis glycosyltransferase
MTGVTLFADRARTAQALARKRSRPDVADVLLALALLAFAAPLMIVIALSIWLQDGGPVLFRQPRVGRDGRAFDCLKFRTMAEGAEDLLAQRLARDAGARQDWAQNRKLRDDPRVTPIGRFLRRSSLDELPQLFNIVRGEMRLVGPRPIMQDEIDLYGVHFRHYCAVRPGITGLWQISGRSDLSFRRRVVLDVAYVRRRDLRLDVEILLCTLPVVLLQRGAC